MSDRVKAAIADAIQTHFALPKEGHYVSSRGLGPGAVADLTERIFGAAVEAGMAPPDETERLRDEIRAHRARCLGPDGLGGDFDDWEQAGRRLWAALDGDDR